MVRVDRVASGMPLDHAIFSHIWVAQYLCGCPVGERTKEPLAGADDAKTEQAGTSITMYPRQRVTIYEELESTFLHSVKSARPFFMFRCC
jgi:hypothetical protein